MFHAAFFTHPDLLDVLVLLVLFVEDGVVLPYYWLNDVHGVVKESTSNVAPRLANMSIASHQEDKVE